MRYIVGIDLGTTNSCISYIDTQNKNQTIQQFVIPQLKEAAHVESLSTLPSACYLASPHEWPKGSLDLPWKKNSPYFVGAFALSHGSKVPTKLVQSAKSWLCHASAQRNSKILPYEAFEEEIKISPVEASSRYLAHMKEAWNYVMATGNPEYELQQQEIVLTVPASFDEWARKLTADAAKLAGFTHLTLLEEPQAAFYSWISRHEKNLEAKIQTGTSILVCDVGGGTTDFSLIEYSAKEGIPTFRRMAVGNHLLLGGDNMDAALAHHIEAKARHAGIKECTPYQWLQLRQQARKAKEVLLGDSAPEKYTIFLQGQGSSIIKDSFAIEVERSETLDLLEKGFFASVSWEEALKMPKTSGIRTMGLPYEEEPSIVKQMAFFLRSADVYQHLQSERGSPPRGGKVDEEDQFGKAVASQNGNFQLDAGIKPDYVLFNGGAMKPRAFQQAILNALQTWFPEKKIFALESGSLDLSVSRGAAYYGKVRRGEGVRISGGAARGYYLGIEHEGKERAMALLPRGAEEGSLYSPDQTFWLAPNTPVTFKLYSSHVRLADEPGAILEIVPEEFNLLPPLQTLLHLGKGITSQGIKEKIPVRLKVTLTAIGTLEILLKGENTPHQWALEFQVKSADGQLNSLDCLNSSRRDETFDPGMLEPSKALMRALFTGEIKASQIMERLEASLERPRWEWSPSVLRHLWEEVCALASERKRSRELEARWWNLAGFLLRPGIGYPMDDFRMKDLWKIILSDLQFNRIEEVQIQKWICWRRVAGGFNKGQQMQMANEIWPQLIDKKTGQIEVKHKSELYGYQEKIRALASFEQMNASLKIRFGNLLVERMLKITPSPAELWALARLGARHLLHGSLSEAVPPEIAADWAEAVLKMDVGDPLQKIFVLGQIAGATEQRELKLSQASLEKIVAHFSESPYSEALRKALFELNPWTSLEQEKVYGDGLPLGISLNR